MKNKSEKRWDRLPTWINSTLHPAQITPPSELFLGGGGVWTWSLSSPGCPGARYAEQASLTEPCLTAPACWNTSSVRYQLLKSLLTHPYPWKLPPLLSVLPCPPPEILIPVCLSHHRHPRSSSHGPQHQRLGNALVLVSSCIIW